MPSDKSQLHKDHRSRLRKRFALEGLDNFEDHNVLELLLFYVIPRRDTNEIAHQLLAEFGSLSSVFDADIESLTSVPGIGYESALFIKLIPSMWRRCETDRVMTRMSIRSTEEAVEFLRPQFIGKTNEQMIAVLLDGRGNIIRHFLLDEGLGDYLTVNSNKLMKEIMNTNAMGVILAHSHPHGFAIPSPEDITATDFLLKKLMQNRVGLCDHIIFSDSDYFSFAQANRYGIPSELLSFGKTK